MVLNSSGSQVDDASDKQLHYSKLFTLSLSPDLMVLRWWVVGFPQTTFNFLGVLFSIQATFGQEEDPKAQRRANMKQVTIHTFHL